MTPLADLFARTRAQGRKAFMPFITAGDPDLDLTTDVLAELASRGADLCEVGIPYSDPIADGPVIQASYTRALARGIKLSQICDQIERAQDRLTAPLVMMVSYAIILRQGLEAFVERAQRAGFVGAIVPDLLVEESPPLAEICRRAGFDLIQLITPTTPRDRALRIAEQTTGFIYYVSVTGITGERTSLPPALIESVGWLRERTPLPICIGFGISQPEHIERLKPVADGVIVGSAIVRRLAESTDKPRSQLIREIGDYAATLIEACR